MSARACSKLTFFEVALEGRELSGNSSTPIAEFELQASTVLLFPSALMFGYRVLWFVENPGNRLQEPFARRISGPFGTYPIILYNSHFFHDNGSGTHIFFFSWSPLFVRPVVDLQEERLLWLAYSFKQDVMRNIAPFAVITGASRGIGAEYAKALAAQGYDLLLVARDQNRLTQLSKVIQQTSSVQIWTESLDLATPQAAGTLYRLAQSYRPHVSLLVNNAGFGFYGSFTDMPLSTVQDMLQVHIHVTTESTRLFLPDMMNRRQGAIINVASVAGFFPIPYMAEYAATKSFIISFSEAVAMEARESEVTIQVCCPGYTETDFHKTAGH
ncbi:MAG TPA: hypothetical protein DD706_12875, partial [Nitrospiraceae bacterium]|nr:hypothetical protein [Nitrospiraceae bacterium]